MGSQDFSCLLVGHPQSHRCYVRIELSDKHHHSMSLHDVIMEVFGSEYSIGSEDVNGDLYEGDECYGDSDLEPGFFVGAILVFPHGRPAKVNLVSFFNYTKQPMYTVVTHNNCDTREFSFEGKTLTLSYKNPINLEKEYRSMNEETKKPFELCGYAFNKQKGMKYCDCNFLYPEKECKYHGQFFMATFHPQAFWHLVCEEPGTPVELLWNVCQNTSYVPKSLREKWKKMTYVEAERAIREYFGYIRDFFQEHGQLETVRERLREEELCTKGFARFIVNNKSPESDMKKKKKVKRT